MNNNFNGIFYFMEWIFDGIGTEIISLLIGLAGGGAIGYRISDELSSLIFYGSQ